MIRSIAKRVLFIGDSVRLASVSMRCRQIADVLGAAWTTPDKPGTTWHASKVPEAELTGRDIFVLVKAEVDRRELCQRGRVVWDVLDVVPPREHIDAYLTSTRSVAHLLGPCIPTFTIPQHHCNSQGRMLVPDPVRGRMMWIGSEQWLPDELAAQGVEVHVVGALSASEACRLYSRADVVINARRYYPEMPVFSFGHAILNGGIKVINAVGFGLPSVTEWEPWVDEVAPGCTVVCAPGDTVATAQRLLRDPARYATLRARCIQTADQYSLRVIASTYADVLEQIAALPRRETPPGPVEPSHE